MIKKRTEFEPQKSIKIRTNFSSMHQNKMVAATATALFLKPSFTSPPPSSSNLIRLHPRRSSHSLPRNPGRCLAAKSGPPSPPESEQNQLTALAGSLSEFQDKVQIFFSVLFWMSLFFWASVWDDRDRPNKGSRFKR